MTDARAEEPQHGQLTEEELQKDSMFMHWREHHARAKQAYKDEDFDQIESLCEETIMQPWGVPRIYQAEAHAMLATLGHREDCVERALAAKEQYRRIFLANRDNPDSEKLYRNVHNFVRTVQKDCGMTELSPLYEDQESVGKSSQAIPSILVGSGEEVPSPTPSVSDDTVDTSTEAGTPIVSPVSSFGPSTPGTERTTSTIAEAPVTVKGPKKSRRHKEARIPVTQLFSDNSQPATILPSRPIALPKRDVAAMIAEGEEEKQAGRASPEREREPTMPPGIVKRLGSPKKEVGFSASPSTDKKLGSPIKLTKKKSYRDALRDAYKEDKKP